MINTLNARLKSKKKGFTLIELIIVIAIIAIIAAIAIPNYTKIRNDSKLKADQQSCDTIKKITQTLLVDGTLKNSESVALTFSNKTLQTATATIGGTSTTVTDFYKDVKAPQVDGATNYTINITNAGGVEVTNGEGADTGTP